MTATNSTRELVYLQDNQLYYTTAKSTIFSACFFGTLYYLL